LTTLATYFFALPVSKKVTIAVSKKVIQNIPFPLYDFFDFLRNMAASCGIWLLQLYRRTDVKSSTFAKLLNYFSTTMACHDAVNIHVLRDWKNISPNLGYKLRFLVIRPVSARHTR
jgi:hypothetical protein